MLIGEVAAATGVTPKTLRFYERRALLHEPARTTGGYRDYDPTVIDRVAFIKQAQAAGLTLAQIGEILDIRDQGRAPCDHVTQLVDRSLAEIQRRRRELDDIERHLTDVKQRLEGLTPADCDPSSVCIAVRP